VQLPDVPSLKLPAMRLAFFTLTIYMVNRAINAIIAPGESRILEAQPQEQARAAFPFEFDFDTMYVSNSIIFPIILVILYRLARLDVFKPLMAIIIIHFASIVLVLGLTISQISLDLADDAASLTYYRGSDGQTYTVSYSQQGGPQGSLSPNDIRWQNEEAVFEADDGTEILLQEIEEPGISTAALLTQAFTPLMIAVFALLSAVSLPYFYRLDYAAAVPAPPDASSE